MSDPIDIKALDEYLKGGSDISQRYRELGSEGVPPELDRRVLDEAHAAVAGGGGTRSRSWLRWSAPVALAATVVLGIAVVIESGVQNDASFATKAVDKARPAAQRQAEEYKLQEKPAAPPAVAPEFVPEPAPPAALAKTEAQRAKSDAPEEVRVDATVLRDQSMNSPAVAIESLTIDSPEPQLANSQPAPSVSRAIPPDSARKEVAGAWAQTRAQTSADTSAEREADSASGAIVEEAVVTGRVRRAPGRTAGPRNTISSQALSSETRPPADEDAEQSAPEKWLERIRDLRRAGKTVEADRAWQQFRTAFPDFPVANDDLARSKP